MCDREPAPEEVALLIETVEELLEKCTGRQRQIAELLLLGYNEVEICRMTGCTERLVLRTRTCLAKWLQDQVRE